MAERPLAAFDAVLFDLDGVITESATLHRACWKEMFDEYLRMRAAARGEPFEPFTDEDYRRSVDGRLRYDGVRTFLESRGISLPEGHPDDPPSAETVCGLGNRKNSLIVAMLDERGIATYPDAVSLIGRLRERRIPMAVVSASKNCAAMLEAAGMAGSFAVRVDGWVAAGLGLPGKPAPDTFLEGARRLGVAPERAAVLEDAISGVQAGRAGGFGLVVGVDRIGDPDGLAANGADLVVDDLTGLL